MPNYQNGKIYKIICDENDLVYYGSTTVPLWQRIGKHRIDYKMYLEGNRKYMTSYEVVKCESHKIILVEDFSCERKEQLLGRERFWIENNKCVNKCLPILNVNENRRHDYYLTYKSKNIDKLKEKNKKYRENNKAQIKEYRQKYKKTRIVCDCGVELCKGALHRHLRSQRHINLSLPMGF